MKRLVVRISIILGVAAIATGTFFLVRSQFSGSGKTAANDQDPQTVNKETAPEAVPKPIPVAQDDAAPPAMPSPWGTNQASTWGSEKSSAGAPVEQAPEHFGGGSQHNGFSNQPPAENSFADQNTAHGGTPAKAASYGSGSAPVAGGAPVNPVPYTTPPRQDASNQDPWGQTASTSNDGWGQPAATANVQDPSQSAAAGNPYRGDSAAQNSSSGFQTQGGYDDSRTAHPNSAFGSSNSTTSTPGGGFSSQPSSRNSKAVGGYNSSNEQYRDDTATQHNSNDGWPNNTASTGSTYGGPSYSTASTAANQSPPAPPAPVTGGGYSNTTPEQTYTPTPDTYGTGAPSGALGGSVGIGKPGAKKLEGPQSPSLTIEKMAPEEIQIGKKAIFKIRIRNIGTAAARDVVVKDEIPGGTRLENAEPAANTMGSTVLWKIGTLEPNQEAIVSMELMPLEEGEIGSVATVSFQSEASARTVATRPLLKIEHSAPARVMLGQTVTLDIKLINPGSGAATKVVMEEDVPEGLFHEAGRELISDVGVLKPGETRTMQLTLKATKAGVVRNTIRASAEAGLRADHTIDVEVIAPQLAVKIGGPSRRYLDRKATYEIAINNPGTAPAKEVELVARLPKGMRFVEADQQGQYDADMHAVFWSLPELPVRQTGVVHLTTLPVETGEQKIRVESGADMDLSSAQEKIVSVESVASLYFEVVDAADPIELGRDAEYKVRVINQGTKAASNVRLVAMLPPGMTPIEGNGPTRGMVNGDRVIFDPVGRLAPKQEAVFKFRAKGVQAGDQRIRVELGSDDMQTAVAKEECTRVYLDR